MSGGLPAISGAKLAALLEKDGWQFVRDSTHGAAYTKTFADGPRIATVQTRRKSLARGTLAAILGPKQTGLGRRGLERLLRRHG